MTKKTIISYWGHLDVPHDPVFHGLVEDFNRTHLDIQVEYRETPWDEERDILLRAIAEGNPPDCSTVAEYWIGEFIATFGLIATILGCVRFNLNLVAPAVALYISSAYWFTSSTSFANPAVTIARALTDTFSGIYPAHAPAFIAAQFAGAIVCVLVLKPLFPSEPETEGRAAAV